MLESMNIPKLLPDGKNFWQWDQAMEIYATSIGASLILDGSYPRPLPRENHFKALNKPQEDVSTWDRLEAQLKMAILSTVPQGIYSALPRKETAHKQYEAVKRRFREQGINEEFNVWADFFRLRASDCSSTLKFTDRFQAGAAAIQDIGIVLPNKALTFQFLLAIEETFPDYARDRRHDLRQSKELDYTHMINEINDEARRNDPVKTSAFASRTEKRNNRDKSHGNKDRAYNGSRKQSEYCELCKKHHVGAGVKCRRNRPENASQERRDRNNEKSTASQKPLNAAAVNMSSRSSSPSTQYEKDLYISDDTVGRPFNFSAVPLATISDQAMKLAGRKDYRLRTICDTGATDHICNQRDKFIKITPTDCPGIRTGGGIARVEGIGTIALKILRSDGAINDVTFSGVLYSPDMFVSVLSHSRLREKGLYYHGWEEKIIQKSTNYEIAFCPEIDGIPNFLEASNRLEAAQAFSFAAVQASKSHKALVPTRKVTLFELHEMYGHADPESLKELVKSVSGLELIDTTKFSCEACLLGKSKKQISRRMPERASRPFHRIHVDVVGPISPTGINGERYWVLFTDDYTRYRWIYLVDTKAKISTAFLRFHKMVKTQYRATVAIYHLDNDLTLINRDTRQQLHDDGAKFEPSTPYTAHQNGVAESSNRLEEERIRPMILAAPHLPKSLWPYAAHYTCELLNHSLSSALPKGKTPRQLLLESLGVSNTTPNCWSLRKWGELGFVHIPQQRRVKSQKFAPRSLKAYYIGREGSRIFLMWDSASNKVIRTSSVRFAKHSLEEIKVPQDQLDDSRIYSPAETRIDSPTDPSTVQLPIYTSFQRRDKIQQSGGERTPQNQTSQHMSPIPESGGVQTQYDDSEDIILPDLGSGYDFDTLSEDAVQAQLRAELSERASTPAPPLRADEVSESLFDTPSPFARAHSAQDPVTPTRKPTKRTRRPLQDDARRHDEISADFNPQLILPHKRRPKPTALASFADNQSNMNIPARVVRCFATALVNDTYGLKNDPNLPSEPMNHKQAQRHIYSRQWLDAEEEEYRSHFANNTWTTVDLPSGKKALPTKWVYKYKFDDHGKLVRFKARLVVCGNRQNTELWKETYAAVARATTLKILLALVAALDLECDQLDVVTAFLNGVLDDDEEVYIKLPNGQYAKLNKALYGLRRSPRLWYEELSRFLASINYHPLEADPCVFVNRDTKCILLAYVDDIILIAATKTALKQLKDQLMGKYKCRDMGSINHYLGIRIRRDRSRRTIELSMEPYIDKMAKDYNRSPIILRKTPMDTDAVKLKSRPKEDPPPDNLTLSYQSLIGKLLYPAVQLRTDIAFHVSFLARFLSNPSEKHMAYAYQIFDYLIATKDLVMAFSAPYGIETLSVDIATRQQPKINHLGLGLHGYSDSSHADAEDRKSTSGYMFKFAGGTVCHKSSKQKLVTTSTTEAEYVGLTYAAKEAAWLCRLLHQLGYDGNDIRPIKLYGDNQPSINIVHAEGHHERTKYIDIYYHYIRERVKDGHIDLQYVRTGEMIADGLTKPLAPVAHERFVKQIGLRKPLLADDEYSTPSNTD